MSATTASRPTSGAVYGPAHQRLLPLEDAWRRTLAQLPWPKGNPARGGIDEELFDVIAGFEALSGSPRGPGPGAVQP